MQLQVDQRRNKNGEMKLIIDNRSDLDIQYCIKMVVMVIANGRISNNGKQYCYASSFTVGDDEYMIVTDVNKKSDRFVITKHTKQESQ